jgi:ribose-phosphate pyrophosphokinase
MDGTIIFSTRNYAGLGSDIAWAGGFASGAVEARTWPDGELYQIVKTPVSGRDVALVAGTGGESDTLEAFDLACALVGLGARRLTVFIPFFGYSTMEKSRRPGAVLAAKSRALLWSALPRAAQGNQILILEPHSPGLPLYFGPENRVAGIDSASLMMEMLEDFPAAGHVLCSPDIGRIKWVDALASATGREAAYVLKRRLEGGGVKALGVTGDLKGRTVILCDDMIRSGDTLLRAAEACLEAGAREVSAVAIHGAFAPVALRTLRDSGLLKSLRCTDSHPEARRHASDWPAVTSCKDLAARVLASS